MKKSLIFLSVCLALIVAGSASASVTAVQTGNWMDPNTWDKGVPDDTEEIKIGSGDGGTVTINSDIGTYTQKTDVSRDMTLEIVDGGVVTFTNELRPGDAGMSGSGTDIGYINQTGGSVTVTGKLLIGYKTGGDGTYTISGGSLGGSTGRMYIGCDGGDGEFGKFKVVGSAATISFENDMYIANDSSSSSGDTGEGTVEFVFDAGGAVSKIQVLKSIIDSQDEDAAVAKLVVNMVAGTAAGDVVLIENTGSDGVVGGFDTLNGAVATEGSVYEIGSGWFKLTYLYAAGADMVGNDIALLVVPEPMTIAILGLGGLFLRRRLA